MKKKYLVMLAISIVLFIIVIYQVNRPKKYDIYSIINVKPYEITTVRLHYGRPRLESFIITDKQRIDQFMKVIEQCEVVPIDSQPAIAGYYQACELYRNGESVSKIIFGNPINIDGVYYEVIKGEITANQIDEFMKNP